MTEIYIKERENKSKSKIYEDIPESTLSLTPYDLYDSSWIFIGIKYIWKIWSLTG